MMHYELVMHDGEESASGWSRVSETTDDGFWQNYLADVSDCESSDASRQYRAPLQRAEGSSRYMQGMMSCWVEQSTSSDVDDGESISDSDDNDNVSITESGDVSYQAQFQRAENSSRYMNDMMNWFVHLGLPTSDEEEDDLFLDPDEDENSLVGSLEQEESLNREEWPMANLWRQQRVAPGFYGLVMYNNEIKSMAEDFKRKSNYMEGRFGEEKEIHDPPGHTRCETEALTKASVEATLILPTLETDSVSKDSEMKIFHGSDINVGELHAPSLAKANELHSTPNPRHKRSTYVVSKTRSRRQRRQRIIQKAAGLVAKVKCGKRDDSDGETTSSSWKDMSPEAALNGDADLIWI